MSSRETFLAEIEDFLDRTGLTPTAFGMQAVNDDKFVKRLRAGSDVRLDTADKVRAFMARWKPPPRKGNGRRSEAFAA